MQHTCQAKLRVQKLRYLPPLSTTASRLLAMLGDDSFTLQDLAVVISQDPGLSARILGLANSAYFGQTKPILTVEDAIIRVLGLNMVKSLAFSIAVSGAFESSACHGFKLQKYWNQSLSIAMLSRQIGQAVECEIQPDVDGVYLAGLLFDLGVLVLVHEFPQEYARVLSISEQRSDRDLLEIETEIIGVDHRQAGVWLGHRWHLPDVVIKTIAQETGEGEDCDRGCESLLVGNVAEWIKNPLPMESKPALALPELEKHCRLSKAQLDAIKADFQDKQEEIHLIAKMLAR